MGDQQALSIQKRKRPRRFQKSIKRFVGLLGTAAILSTAFLGADAALTTTPASAAPGDPFSPNEPTVFIVQGNPAQLQRAVTTGSGTFEFEDEGPLAPTSYNAIGYNPQDGYIYGIAHSASVPEYPQGSLLRVGQEGQITRIGNQIYTHPGGGTNDRRFFAGEFNPQDGLFYVSDSGPNTTVLAIDVSDGSIQRTIDLGTNPGVQDFTFSDGYAWGSNNAGDLRRLDIQSGAIDVFPGILPTTSGGYGGAWTFGNGNLGFSANANGDVVQVEVTGGDTANPEFRVISVTPGPSSSLNDGTSIPGLPTDLSIEKSAPETFVSGDRISYDIVVTNNGPGVSSGWTATDILPEGLFDPEFSGDGSPAIDPETGVVTVSGGRLAPGETAQFTVTAGTDVAAGECITNDASILGNEEDPNPENDQDSVTSCENSTTLTVEKSSNATVDARPGDTVEYTITATNTGTGDYTEDNPAVVFDDLSGVLDDAEYNDDAVASVDGELAYAEPLLNWSGPLAAGETVELTYTVTLQGGGDGEVRNVAWEPNDPEDPTPPVCDPATEDGTDPDTGEACGLVENLLPKLSIAKTADTNDLPAVGGDATFTVTVTNEGPGDYTVEAPASMSDNLTEVLDDAILDEESITASVGEATYDDGTLNWSGPLAAGESAEISYTVTYTGEGDQQLVNNACLPEDDIVADGDACATVTIPGSDLDSWKAVDASDDPVVAGSELTYTLFFENTGNTAATVDSVDLLTHVLDDAEVTAEPVADDGLDAVRDGDTIAITGEVPAGETLTVSYTVTVLPDGERGDDQAANFLLPNDPDNPPTPPEDPTCEPADEERPDCTVTPIGGLTYEKTVEASDEPLVAGSELTYSIVINNIGQTTMAVSREDVLDDVLDDTTLLSGPESDTDSVTVTEVDDNNRFEIAGELAAGETATVTYTVAVNDQDDRGNNTADNFLVTVGDEPPTECEDGSSECTVTPLPLINAVKDVDPASGSTVMAGDELTYTLTFTNTGNAAGAVDYTDHLANVLDDAQLVTQPSATDGLLDVSPVADDQFTVSGTLEAGAEETVTYTVEVGADGERGDNVLGNFLMETGEEPPAECDEDNPNCTTNPVPHIEDWKTVEADPTPVAAGTVLTYTLHFENIGAAAGTIDRVDDLTHVLDDATFDEESITSDEALSIGVLEGNRLPITGELGAGETATITYQVVINDDGDRGDDVATNFLLNPDEEVPSDVCQPEDDERPDCTTTPIGQLLVTKSVAASADPVIAGTDLTYTLTFDNQGQGPVAIDHTDILTDVLDDAAMTSDPSTEYDGLDVSEVEDGQFTVTGEVEAGEAATVQYTVTVNEETDRGNNSADNFLVPTGETPPETCEDDSPLCTVTPLPNLDVDKSVNPTSGSTVVAGDELTYTLTFTNDGAGPAPVNYTDHLDGVLDDATITADPAASSDALNVSAVESDRFTITGELAAGESATVTYTVEVGADGERGDNMLGNFLVETGEEPPAECTDDTPNCTTNPVPHLESWKTVDPSSTTPVVAGQELTYTLHFENIGAATGTVKQVDDLTHVLDDAEIIAEPTASHDNWTVERDGQRIEFKGEVAAGKIETIQYTVRVLETEDRGDDVLANFLLDPDAETPTDPVCEPSNDERPDCTTNPVGNIIPTKSVDPETGTEVQAGQELTYTLSFENTGTGAAEIDYIDHMADVLDDAELVGDVETTNGASVAGPSDNQLLISGSVAPGETATVTYTVVVKEYDDRGNHQLGNFLTLVDQEPPTECTDNNPLCTFNPTPTDPTQPGDPADPQPGDPADPAEPKDDLASTGTTVFWWLVGLGVALLGAGIAFYLARNRRANT